MNEKFQYIPVNDIHPNPNQPRTEFDNKKIEELAKSIKANGLIQPIIVKVSDLFGYELIAGERRLRAFKLLGLQTIPAVIKSVDTIGSIKQAMVENLQRSDLNPFEEALAYQNLITETNMTHDEVAKYMGKSRPYISNSLRLLQLPEELQNDVIEEKISQGHARLLLSLDNKEEQIHWSNRIQKEHLSVRSLEKLLQQAQSKTIKPKIKRKDLFVADIENQLKQHLGLQVTISQSKNQSRTLQIHFDNQEDFEKIINKLKS